MREIHLLIGILFIAFGLIGLVRPTRLHQAVTIKKFSLSKRRWNLVPLIIGIVFASSILVDFIYAIASVTFIFCLIGLIRPTLMHQAVKIGRIHFASRLWNLGIFVLAGLIMAVFAIPAHFASHMRISEENRELNYELSNLEVEVKKLN